MAQHAHVPQFGNWENDDSVPYTQYFENARKGKSGGKTINPNDPERDSEAFHSDVPAIDTHDSEPPKPNDALQTNNDDGFSQSTESDSHQSTAARKPTTDSRHHKHGHRPNSGDYQRRVHRHSGGSDNTIDRSPLHPHYQAKAANKGNISSNSKSSSESSHTVNSSSTGRSRMRTGGRVDETQEKGSVVPKFGGWDESNPSSGDGYTDIFNQVRVEKQTGSAKSPMISNDIIYIPGQESRNDTSCCGCFSWFKK